MTLTLSPAATRPVASPLLPTNLYPAMCPHTLAKPVRLSDDGFFDSIVSVNLCQGHDMRLKCLTPGSHASVDVSHRGLATLGLSVHHAWQLAARNVLAAAATERGYRFLTRPCQPNSGRRSTRQLPPGVQVYTDTLPVTAWLAHPMTFSVLHQHLSGLLGSTQLVYCAPTAQVLCVFAHASPSQLRSLQAFTDRMAGVSTPTTATAPLAWANGFPRALQV
ncbi:hypothetical protein G7Y31_07855 [Corynebacterium lizhenjunii]|uniref:Uncharacterized protein n=1 Tax=Corynebacterium lizhenjunii TaxID=2709394 RepID=A0A7T0P979_9CORY|nr:hypothetical protein [Corynebacterium lizhenjunii]QPK78478.1 hypothetical protein G7Y31_07855 [Corynebacterium lizhenjunii]